MRIGNIPSTLNAYLAYSDSDIRLVKLEKSLFLVKAPSTPSLQIWWENNKNIPPFRSMKLDIKNPGQAHLSLKIENSKWPASSHLESQNIKFTDFLDVLPEIEEIFYIGSHRCQVTHLIHKGESSYIYLAEELDQHKKMVIKISTDDENIEHLILERLCRGKSSEHIVGYYGHATIWGKTWILLEDLSHCMTIDQYKKTQKLNDDQHFNAQYDEAVRFLASRDISRELSDKDVLVTPDGLIKIIGWQPSWEPSEDLRPSSF